MKAATRPAIASRDARLIVAGAGGLSHLSRSAFPAVLHPGDLVVANDAATLPASLTGTQPGWMEPPAFDDKRRRCGQNA
jgi:S-adenosylmethionine:tRNA ribosyltransferase-isomerase